MRAAALRTVAILVLVWMLPQAAAAQPATPGAAPAAAGNMHPLYRFNNQGFEFAYLKWANAVTVGPEFVTIAGEGVTDGGGALHNVAMDLSAYAASVPVLVVRPGPGNKADHIAFGIRDTSGIAARYAFLLKGLPNDRFSTVFPEDGATLGEPVTLATEKEGAPRPLKIDLAHINLWQIQGNWQNRPLEVAIEGVYLAADVPQAVVDARAKAFEQRRQREAEEQRQAEAKAARIKQLLADCPHPADGARLVNIAPVGSDMLGIELQAGEYEYGRVEAYSPQPGDELVEGSSEWTIENGAMVKKTVGQKVRRKGPDGKAADLGTITPDGRQVLVPGRVSGTPLEPATIELPAAYLISSSDDPNYATPVPPVKVYRKSKPNSPIEPVGGFATLHRIYLQLPAPLRPGAGYTVAFKGINARDAQVQFVNDSRRLRSEAVHASHVGYHPDAPFKRAYLSVWLGTGGGYDHPSVETFEVLDAESRAVVYTGKVSIGKARDDVEQLQQQKNYAMTAVRWLDFADLRTPGRYVVHVPGIGTSYPFAVGDQVWEEPARLSLRGILAQRSSIALGPPMVSLNRPRPYHPDEGDKFYQLDIGVADGQEGGRGEALERLWNKNGKLEEVTGVWGGYQDAGDWDSYTTSLITAQRLTELFDVTGDWGRNLKLVLPDGESSNAIPDLLDEALWGVSFYKRIQLPDGAVRDGFGDGWGARPGDLSWNNSNPVGVYAPSVGTSFEYAAAAAHMARLLGRYDESQAGEYRRSAIAAWNWARAKQPEPAAKGSGAAGGMAHAAVQLYWLTGEPQYHDVFKGVTELDGPVPDDYAGGWIEPMQQGNADFVYARLPDELADAALKQNALKRYALSAKIGRHFAAHNAFNVATNYPGIPCLDFLGYFTAPGGIINVDLVRCHVLSGSDQDMATILASTNFTLGANPENMAMTTGLGPNPVRFPLKLDSLRTGQPAPEGITVYGAADQSTPSTEWVHIWLIGGEKTVPNSRSWPAQESYFDVFGWPGCNEFTVDRPMALAAYTWGYLASTRAR